MPDYYVPISETRFVDYNVGGYHILAPHFVAERHPREEWEQARFRSMEKHLRRGMVLMDIGSEQGYQSAIYSRFVGGGHNMVLIEPVPQVWPNTRYTWEANNLCTPRATYCGFIGECSWVSEHHDFPVGYRGGWPECAYSDQLLDATKFRYTHEHEHSTDSTTLDEFIPYHLIFPDAITIDIEGYEPLVIQGAIRSLAAYRPMLWISVHRPGQNNILHKFTGSDRIDEMYDILQGIGYQSETIAEDHEIHTFWRVKE